MSFSCYENQCYYCLTSSFPSRISNLEFCTLKNKVLKAQVNEKIYLIFITTNWEYLSIYPYRVYYYCNYYRLEINEPSSTLFIIFIKANLSLLWFPWYRVLTFMMNWFRILNSVKTNWNKLHKRYKNLMYRLYHTEKSGNL